MWKMLHNENAIEGAAMTVRFAEPLSSMVAKKVVREIEGRASDAGFFDRQPLQQFQFQLDGKDVRQSSVVGMVFQHNKLIRDAAGNVAPQPARHFVVQPEQTVMQIQRYRGWEIEWPDAVKLLGPTLSIAAGVVPIAAFRLEYLNRFIFDGPEEEGSVTDLLQKSDFVAPHVFEASDLFHSHTGRFDDVSSSSRRLTQVNADLQILNVPHPTAGNRTLALMLAVERQFSGPGLEMDPGEVEEVATKYFSCLHDDIHALFKKLVDSEFASENNLPQ
ncbi:TIGR04255 family protein [Rhizobium leguminosarum]|uniref:TIGR04255 family protein n=1 Tax=Rhizobium leguminosarum TaxID=384 RepID=UPI003F9B4761